MPANMYQGSTGEAQSFPSEAKELAEAYTALITAEGQFQAAEWNIKECEGRYIECSARYRKAVENAAQMLKANAPGQQRLQETGDIQGGDGSFQNAGAMPLAPASYVPGYQNGVKVARILG